MDRSDRAWRRPALAALAVAALLAVVALTSGDRPWSTGDSDSKPLPQAFWDAVWTIAFLLWLVAVAIAARRAHVARRERGASSWKEQLKALLAIIALVGAGVLVFAQVQHLRHAPATADGTQAAPGRDPASALQRLRNRGVPEEPQVSLPAAILTVAIVAGVVALIVARRRRRPQLTSRQTAAAALAEALDESLDDLRGETDPRRAVIAAYARMERVLAAHFLARAASEAPGEYLARVLGELGASGESAERLTELYARAKFSPHEVDAAMKDDAIAALETLRDELRAAP